MLADIGPVLDVGGADDFAARQKLNAGIGERSANGSQRFFLSADATTRGSPHVRPPSVDFAIGPHPPPWFIVHTQKSVVPSGARSVVGWPWYVVSVPAATITCRFVSPLKSTSGSASPARTSQHVASSEQKTIM